MSPDLRKQLLRSAPDPSGELDLNALAARANRHRLSVIVSVSAIVVLVAVSAAVAFTAFDDRSKLVVVQPDESPSPSSTPDGKKHVVIEGTFDDSEAWGKHAGRPWRVVLQTSPDGTECWHLGVGSDLEDIGGTACTFDDLSFQRPIGARHYSPGGEFGNELAIVVGQARPDVAEMRIEFSGPRVQTLSVEPVMPPPEAAGSWNYYIAFLPPDQNGYVVALDDQDQVLQRDRLCELDCKESEFQSADGAERIPASDGRISTGGYLFKDLYFMAGGHFDPSSGTDHISLHGYFGPEDGFPGRKICTWTVFDADGNEIGSTSGGFTAQQQGQGTIKDTLVVTGWPHSIAIDCSGERLDDPSGHFEFTDVRPVVEDQPRGPGQISVHLRWDWIGEGTPTPQMCEISVFAEDGSLILRSENGFTAMDSGPHRSEFRVGKARTDVEPTSADISCLPID